MKTKNKFRLSLSGNETHYIQKVLKEMQKDSDRATAILLVAELDDMLHQILEKRLLLPQQKSTRLLEQDSPIGSFSARIELTYRLGLIHPFVHKELHLIRKIRNEFAHKKAGLSFKTQPVNQLAFQLEFPKAAEHFFLQKDKVVLNPNARSCYVISGALLMWRLKILQEQTRRIKKTADTKL